MMKSLASPHFIFLLFLCSWWSLASTESPDSDQLGTSFDNPLEISNEEYPASEIRLNFKDKRQTAAELKSEEDEVASPSPSPPVSPEDQNLTGTEEPSVSESPSTASTSSSTTSEVPTTSTSTPPPTTTEKPFVVEEGETKKGYFCLCDLHVRSCDMNCCCDMDCSEEEKKLFTGCTGSVIYDPKNHRNKDHSCMKSYIMYRENIPYRIDRTDKSLFCIVKENVKQGREFSQKDMNRIKNQISHGKINAKPKYGWDHLHFMQDFKISPTPYKYGSPIWTVKTEEDEDAERSQETILRLPTAYHTESCSLNEPVQFLVDSTSTCILSTVPVDIQCESLRALNANYFIKNYSIIINPTRVEENSTDYIVQSVIPVEVCHNDGKNCKEIAQDTTAHEEGVVYFDEVKDVELPNPVLSMEKKKCLNVLSHLSLTFVHDGMEGINRTIAKVRLMDVPLDAKQIRQHFNVGFIWGSKKKAGPRANGVQRNNTNETSSVEDILALRKLPRSGNPGYIVSKPVIMGKKITEKAVGVNDTGSAKMHVVPDDFQWLHIHQAGDCPLPGSKIKEFSKYPVVFGYEQVSSCKLSLEPFRSCEELQKHITSILLGIITAKDPKDMIKSPPYVAAYGSPDSFPSDWVPLKFIEMSPLLVGSSLSFPPSSSFLSQNMISGECDITASIHATIAYAYVGPVDAPQAKITGVFYEPEEPIQIPAADTEGNNRKIRDIAVTTTVSFVDVSGKPTTRVATWPVLSIQLPSDFFYPFSSSSTASPSSGGRIIWTNNLSTFILLFVGMFLLV